MRYKDGRSHGGTVLSAHQGGAKWVRTFIGRVSRILEWEIQSLCIRHAALLCLVILTLLMVRWCTWRGGMYQQSVMYVGLKRGM